ncbi:hypothetical protein [Actinocorallia sp. A-T 12471]|uniref:hypothetical protein n=1 Tax=Actinocorallia sp. A-T 12471 TaxID=3089813 RepID=UPI0029CB5AA9|nr:hypothetical protein [Actinocorallia sp. A-T 12471]MDX6740105.1 hypothetical protein [Actinocorallia sp. A-T 12471]
MPLPHEELVARARALAPGIAARAQETEQLRRPHDDTIAELVDAELIPILVPRRWGGHELGLDTLREVVETISAACLSTGWVLDFYIGHCVFATRFSERAQQEFFADRPFILAPATTSPTTRAERVTGGWRVTGRIPWASGIMHADWAFCVGFTPDNALLAFAVRASEVEIDDVWHMSGMAGTGSNTIILDNVYVPDHRALPVQSLTSGNTPGTAIHPNPLYRAPLIPFLLAQSAPVFSGALRGATTAFTQIIQSRTTTYELKSLKDDPHTHIKLGEATTNAHIAERLVSDLVAQVTTRIPTDFPLSTRVNLKSQTAYLARHCLNAVSDMSTTAGAAAHSLSSPLQRFHRDLTLLSTHAFWSWQTSTEQSGRHTLSLPPTTPLL